MDEEAGHFPGLYFSVAKGALREAAIDARRAIYTAELGYHGVDEFDRDARQIVAATVTGEIAAACRMIGPERRPLEIETAVNLDELLGSPRRPAQIGGLVVHPERRSPAHGYLLPLALMRCLYLVAERTGATDLVLRTHVDAVRILYRRVGFIERTSFGYRHPEWGDVFVMSLDLDEMRSKSLSASDRVRDFVLHGLLANVDLSD
jgi:ribosomal protein S18 acetylase RimI-like enzyme